MFAMGPCSAPAESGDGRAVFAMMPSGQLKMPRLGNYCLTVAGEGVADADIAQGADVTATSANAQHVVEHIAGESDGGWLFRASCIFSCLRADGDAQSYWASGPDPASRVDVQLDFGTSRQIKAVEIDWEHPAQVCLFILALVFWFGSLGAPGPSWFWRVVVREAFELQVARGGVWATIAAISGNNLQTTSYVGPVVSGTALRIRMTRPHPTLGSSDGHAV